MKSSSRFTHVKEKAGKVLHYSLLNRNLQYMEEGVK